MNELGVTIRLPFLPISWKVLEGSSEEQIHKVLDNIGNTCQGFFALVDEGPFENVAIRFSVHHPVGVQNVKKGIGETIFRAMVRKKLVPPETEWSFFAWANDFQTQPWVLITVKEKKDEG